MDAYNIARSYSYLTWMVGLGNLISKVVRELDEGHIYFGIFYIILQVINRKWRKFAKTLNFYEPVKIFLYFLNNMF